MAAISTAILAGSALLSAGVGLYGYSQQAAGRDAQVQAAQRQALIAGQQAQASAAAALSESELTALASQQSYAASAASTDINTQIIRGEQGIEGEKKKQMYLDASRESLNILRDQQRKGALGLAVATAQGAGRAGSSALGGARGQISGQANTNLLGVQQNLQIGESIFGYNADISQQRIGLSQLQTSYAKQQADVQTRQAQLKAQYAQIQAGYTTEYSAAGGQMATGAGQSAFGGSLIGAAQNIFAVGQVGARFGQSLFNPTSGSPTSLTAPYPQYTPSGASPGGSVIT